MINLFEYQNKVDIQDSFEGLEGFLDEIWNSREKNSFYSKNGNDKIESQRFLQFIHKSNELKSNKYVGVIHYEGNKINLLPKIFFDIITKTPGIFFGIKPLIFFSLYSSTDFIFNFLKNFLQLS